MERAKIGAGANGTMGHGVKNGTGSVERMEVEMKATDPAEVQKRSSQWDLIRKNIADSLLPKEFSDPPPFRQMTHV